MSDNHRPVQAPPPFPPPVLLTARRIMGTVLTTPQPTTLSSVSDEDDDDERNIRVPSLERGTSLAGNILLVQDLQNPKATPNRAYLLQRKLKASLHGSVRLGFVLKEPIHGERGLWELVPRNNSTSSNDTNDNDDDANSHAERHFEMVAIKVEPKSSSTSSSSSSNNNNNTELSALQWIGANDPEGVGHLLGPAVLAADAHQIYTITPYQKEGSLLDYCAERGRLPENQARFLFRQLLQALETLQRLELCHRSLSLDNILLQGTTCSISHLESALRIPTDESSSASRQSQYYLIEPQLPDATLNPRWVAPELLKQDAFDGYAVDLWSTAVMLFVMLLGDEALFDAPVPQDRKFKEICILGNLKGALERWQQQRRPRATTSTRTSELVVSEEALDLLQSMLRAEPRDRLKLEQVQSHAWVTAEDTAPPSRLTRSTSFRAAAAAAAASPS